MDQSELPNSLGKQGYGLAMAFKAPVEYNQQWKDFLPGISIINLNANICCGASDKCFSSQCGQWAGMMRVLAAKYLWAAVNECQN